MRVFVAGATGVLGKRVVENLGVRGHDVLGLSRDPDGDAVVEDRGGEPRRGDVLDAETLRPAVESADAVVNVATKIPTDAVPDPADWEQNDRVRREGAANLLEAAAQADVEHYVNESVVWIARPEGGDEFGVDAPRNPTRVTESAADVERAVLEVEHPFRTTVVRNGWCYAPDAAQTRTFGRRLLDRRLPVVGGGLLGRQSARLSAVHADDAAAAVGAVLDHEVEGIVHAVDDEPVEYGAFLRELARQLDAPSPFQLPGWLLRPLLGGQPVRFLTTETATSNERLRATTDWRPQYPSYREGVEQVVEQWVAEGRLQRGDGAPTWNESAGDESAGGAPEGGESAGDAEPDPTPD